MLRCENKHCLKSPYILLGQFLAMQVILVKLVTCVLFIPHIYLYEIWILLTFSDEYLQWYKIKLINFLVITECYYWQLKLTPFHPPSMLFVSYNFSLKLKSNNGSWWRQMSMSLHMAVRRQTFVTETPEDPHRALANLKHKVGFERKSRSCREMSEGSCASANSGMLAVRPMPWHLRWCLFLIQKLQI